jgi:hypothetical protein
MPVVPARRVNYFDRQHIRLAELRDEQTYHVALRRRHNITHHTWGIVLGLEIAIENGVPAVRPGLAVDGYGRELLLVERRVIDRARFDEKATGRLDVWLEYGLEFADDRAASFECDDGDPRRRYRAIEKPSLVLERAGAAAVDPRHPPGVPAEDLQEPLGPGTPDDPRTRWPVYLGRIVMRLDDGGAPQFTIDTSDRVYAGLNGAVIDHPGTPARLELGLRPAEPEQRTIGDETFNYSEGDERDFAVFVPPSEPEDPLEPVIAVYPAATVIRGTTEVRGNVVLDGSSLQFPDAVKADADTGGHAAIYRRGDELRIDLGNLNDEVRKLVIGVTKDDTFHASLEISFPLEPLSTGKPKPVITVFGDLKIEGLIDSPDVRTRTVTAEVQAILAGMVQAGITTAGSS